MGAMALAALIATVFAILAGPIIAVVITRWLDDRRFNKARRWDIMRELMRHRRDLLNPHFVGALNLIAVEFSKDKKVTEAWKKLLVELSEVLPKELSEERSTAQYKKIHEAQTRLLSAVAENLGLNIEQFDIQEAYAPQGWFNVDTDLSRLRGLALAIAEGREALNVVVWEGKNKQPNKAP